MEIIHLDDFLVTSYPSDPLIGDGILDKGEKMIIYGESESGKSMLALQLAFSLTTGTDFLTFPVMERSRVVLLQSEMSPLRHQERCMRMAVAFTPPIDLWVSNIEGMKMNQKAWAESFADRLSVVAPDVVILDPLRAFMDGDENSSQDVERFFEGVAYVQNASGINFTLIYIHHTSKPAMGYSSAGASKFAARGSGVITDRPSTAIGIEVDRDTEPQTHTLHFTKTRNRAKHPDPVSYTIDPATLLYIPTDVKPKLAKYKVVLDVIGEGMWHSEARKELSYYQIEEAIKAGVIGKSSSTGSQKSLWLAPKDEEGE